MKFMTRVRRFWRHAILRRPLRRNFIGGERRPPPRYTGEGSFTRGAIIRVLADGKPRTRRMIAEQLDVTTAHFHLPRMVDAGLLVAQRRDGRTLWYRLSNTPPST